MKLSVSTKIFLGFAVVIIAFGSTCAYALYRMSSLRRSVTVIWKEVIPISNQLEELARQLQAAEELFSLERPSDAGWLLRVLPTLEPFDGPHGIGVAAERLRALTEDGAPLAEADRQALVAIAGKLERFLGGRDFADAVAGEELGELADVRDPIPNDELYDALVRRTLKKASVGELTALSAEARASVRVFRRLNRAVDAAVKALANPIQLIDERAQAEERATTLAVVIIARGGCPPGASPRPPRADSSAARSGRSGLCARPRRRGARGTAGPGSRWSAGSRELLRNMNARGFPRAFIRSQRVCEDKGRFRSRAAGTARPPPLAGDRRRRSSSWQNRVVAAATVPQPRRGGPSPKATYPPPTESGDAEGGRGKASVRSGPGFRCRRSGRALARSDLRCRSPGLGGA